MPKSASHTPRINLSVLTIVLLLTALSFNPVLQADETLVINADQQFNYAERLFQDGKYQLAIQEYERFIHFFASDPRQQVAHYKVGMAFYNTRRYKMAIDHLSQLTTTFELNEIIIKAYFAISNAYIFLAAPGPAITNLKNLDMLADNTDIKDEANYRIAWIYIERGEFEKAHPYFDKISQKNKTKYQLQKITEGLNQAPDIPRKNPKTAGFLSIIPGAGHLYCERYQDALISFLLNGALIFGAYEAFDQDLNAIGGLLTVIELGLYTGNIYSAVSSAHKYNQSQTNRFIERLRTNTKIQLSYDERADQQWQIALMYKF